MQVIEDMKKDILCFFLPGKLMNIIQDQDIDHLVKMQEIIFIVIADRFHKLCLELIGIHI